MAAALWGKVYYNDLYAGELRQEPGGRCLFTYDATYLEAKHPAIAFTLPRQAGPYICEADFIRSSIIWWPKAGCAMRRPAR